MQKWEYLFVIAEYEHKDWRVKPINGKEVENWKTVLYCLIMPIRLVMKVESWFLLPLLQTQSLLLHA